MALSYVVGNAWQLNLLSHTDRRLLDEAEWVLTCNAFPLHWRRVGFRPSLWCYGDTLDVESCLEVRRILEAFMLDEDLRAKLTHLYVCYEFPQSREYQYEKMCPLVREYRRTRWTEWRPDQPVGREFDTIYHYASTITDLVNMAHILTPGNQIRVLGCPYDDRFGHFYGGEPSPISEDRMEWIRMIWRGFQEMRRQGIDVVDANIENNLPIPEECRIPRVGLWD